MSTTINTGWLKDNNGDKFAPKTLTSQVQTSDGILLENKIETDILSAKDEMQEYTDSIASGKANTSHSHSISDVSNLQSSLDAKVPTSRTVNGKALSANITLSASDVGADVSGSANSALSSAKSYTDTKISALINSAPTTLDTLGEIATAMQENESVVEALEDAIGTKANAIHSHAISDVTDLQTTLDGKAAKSHGTHVSWSTTSPKMDGTASVGSETKVARGDHIHPTDTSRASKTEFDSHVADAIIHITSHERAIWNAAKTHADSAHAPSNAEKNQNAFSNVKVGDTTIAADTTTDTLTLEGSNVTITPDATNDKVTIAVASGSTSTVGIVKLTNSTSSTSTTTAATPNSVKSAYDLANTAKTTIDSHSADTTKHITSTERTNWGTAYTHSQAAHAPSNAEANQNAFSNVKVGDTTIVADTKTDTLTFAAGSNITLTPDATNDKITIAAKDTVYTHPTTSGNKHIPSGGKSGQVLKWSADGVAAWGDDKDTTYSAAGTSLGLVKTGGDVTINDGVISVNDDSHAHIIGNIDGLQSALDGKAATSHGTHVSFSSTTPKVAGTASVGSATTVSRSDHVHPAQTSVSGNAGTATKLKTARTVDGVNFDGSVAITHYGTCSTDAGTVAKTVALTDFSLVTGARICVKFTVTNTASSPTLNVNSTGAKAIVYRGSAISAGYLAANRVYEFVYDGTDWELIGDVNIDTKNTAGSTNSSSKLFLVGATSQAANPQTYSHDTAYVGTDGCLYSNSKKVSVEGHNHAASNITSGTLSSDRLPTVPIAKGGTGATTAAGALTNLGLTATATELNYMDGVTSNVQTQFDTINSSLNDVTNKLGGNYLGADILCKRPTTNWKTQFRTQLGLGATDYALGIIRTDEAGIESLPQYSAGLVWAFGDTQGFLMPQYGTDNVYIGGGSGENINWTKRIAWSDHTHNYLPLTGGTLTGNITIDRSSTTDNANLFLKSNARRIILAADSEVNNSNAGIYDETYGRWIIKSDADGEIGLGKFPTFDPTDYVVDNTNYGMLKCYDSYNVSDTPSTYGNVLELNSYRTNHWKPQLWFDGGVGNRVRYRNKGYGTTSMEEWRTLAFTSDIPKFSLSGTTLTITTT